MLIRLTSDEVQYILDNANRQSVSAISAWIGCTPETVRYQMNKHGIKPRNVIKFSMEDTFAIQSMIRNGYSYREIADELQTDVTSLKRRVWHLRSKGVPIGVVKNTTRRSRYESKRVL